MEYSLGYKLSESKEGEKMSEEQSGRVVVVKTKLSKWEVASEINNLNKTVAELRTQNEKLREDMDSLVEQVGGTVYGNDPWGSLVTSCLGSMLDKPRERYSYPDRPLITMLLDHLKLEYATVDKKVSLRPVKKQKKSKRSSDED